MTITLDFTTDLVFKNNSTLKKTVETIMRFYTKILIKNTTNIHNNNTNRIILKSTQASKSSQVCSHL